MGLEIHYFESIDSTQKRLIADIRTQKVIPPVCYYTYKQTDGVGSRNNRWIGIVGNLFFSFALQEKELPPDLPLASISLYFSYLFKTLLVQKGVDVWIKWPNDFYIGEKKCGGCVTNKIKEVVVCGIGLNTYKAPEGFGKVALAIDGYQLLEEYFSLLEQRVLWKEIFSKFALEFHKSKRFITHIGEREVDLCNAQLAEDGALLINGERIYSLR